MEVEISEFSKTTRNNLWYRCTPLRDWLSYFKCLFRLLGFKASPLQGEDTWFDTKKRYMIKVKDVVFYELSKLYFYCENNKMEKWMNMNPYYKLVTGSEIPDKSYFYKSK